VYDDNVCLKKDRQTSEGKTETSTWVWVRVLELFSLGIR